MVVGIRAWERLGVDTGNRGELKDPEQEEKSRRPAQEMPQITHGNQEHQKDEPDHKAGRCPEGEKPNGDTGPADEDQWFLPDPPHEARC
jgi:hypothetical protein